MHPGRSCIACHANSGGEAPTFQIAGTVYPTAQEAYDCLGVNGSAAGVTVQITDAVGKVISLPVNSSGNFYYSGRAGALTLPYHAKVLAGGRERAMGAAQGTGDCNSCHSPTGQGGAPGRVMAP
jgi:mono/diheme cytochrome c family protein